MGSLVGVGAALVDAALIGRYTKLGKTRTFEMNVMQKLHILKLSNFAQIISTYGWSYPYQLISAKWVASTITKPFYSGCLIYKKYDHIKEKSSNEMKFLNDTFQIEMKFVAFAIKD